MPRTLLNRRGRGFALAALALLFGVGTAFAQAGRIEGTVRDASTGDPVAGARVTVIGTQLAGTSNENGYYAIANVPVGTYEVRVNVIGYQQVTITNQRVAAGLPTTVNFTLARSILRIEGVVVTGVAEATQAIKLPFTVDQVKAEDIPVPASNPEEALRGKVAGARVVRGSGLPGSGVSVLLRGVTSISTAGRSNEPLYVVDGVILGASMVDIDALDVETIEVVKGAAAAALFGSRAANGVVQITTRRGRDVPEGDTRITFRSEFGRNFLQEDFRMTRTHFYKTDGTNWLAEAGLLGPDGDTVLTVVDTTFNPDGSITVYQDNTVAIIGPRERRAVDWIYDSTAWAGPESFTQGRYAVSDNPYPGQLFDHMDRFFDPGTYYTNSINISHRTGNTNFMASFHENKESGIVDALDGYLRRGGRVNVDHRIARRLDFSASIMFSQSTADEPFGDNPNPFFTLPRIEGDVDLLKRYPAAQERIDAGVGSARDSNDYLIIPNLEVLEENPMYLVANQDVTNTRGRLLASIGLRWRPTEEFDISGNFSFDRSDRNSTEFWFKDYRTFDPSSLRDGRLRKRNNYSQALNASVTAAYTKRIGLLNTSTKAHVLLERDKDENTTARATRLYVDNVRDLDNSDPDLQRVYGSTSEVRALGYFFTEQMDLNDRYVVDALIRRDGSSLFGPDDRWHWYYRVGGAWRVAQEPWWPFGFLDEFKLRVSRGTAGGRPRFSAQYETYSVGSGGVTKGNLGNKLLRPEKATETEFGVDLIALGRFSLTVSHARSTIEDQILQVPLPGYAGFSRQWQNSGTVRTNTWEATLQAALIQKRDVNWNLNIVWDRTRGIIDSLGAPPFFISASFYARKGDDVGTLYGSRWATQCSDVLFGDGLTLERGFYSGDECLVSQGGAFDINDDGYLVPVGVDNTWRDGIEKHYYGGTVTIDSVSYAWGIPIKGYTIRVDTLPGGVVATDTSRFQKVGSSIPDFNLGVSQTFRWKGFSVYTLFDAQIGGDIYNNTRQWGCRDKTCWEYDQVTQDGALASGDGTDPSGYKSILYGEILYDVNSDNSHFVEDGSFVKFRELALRYTFSRAQLEGFFGGFIKRVSLAVIGRNLMTWTDYSGYDPEVSGLGGSAAYLRYDDFGYPNYRTWTGSIEIEF